MIGQNCGRLRGDEAHLARPGRGLPQGLAVWAATTMISSSSSRSCSAVGRLVGERHQVEILARQAEAGLPRASGRRPRWRGRRVDVAGLQLSVGRHLPRGRRIFSSWEPGVRSIREVTGGAADAGGDVRQRDRPAR